MTENNKIENNETQIIEYYLNNENIYLNSKPYPRSDTYGREGWFYTNTDAGNEPQTDQICNVNIYSELSAKSADINDLSNTLQVNNIKSLSLKLIINGNESTNDTTETIQAYYPFITIGIRPTGVNDLANADGSTPPNYHALIHLKISPTLTDNVNNTEDLIYFYRDANGLMYYKDKPEDDDNIFNDNFKRVIVEENPSNTTDLNLGIIKDIFITSPPQNEIFSVAFLLQSAEIQTKNMTSQNFNRKIQFKNIVTNLVTNKSELVIHDGALNGFTNFQIKTYGYKNCVIFCNITATAAQPQINIFLSYSSDNINYYTDSRNILCQEFETAGTYTGVARLKDVGFQYIKAYSTDATITNAKIIYSVYN